MDKPWYNESDMIIPGGHHGGAAALRPLRLQAAAGVRGVPGGGGAPVGHVAARGHRHPRPDTHLQHRTRPRYQERPHHRPGERCHQQNKTL